MKYEFDWSIVPQYAPLFWKGALVTLELSAISIVLSTVVGTFLGLGRLSHRAPSRWISSACVEFFLNTPLVVQLFFWYFGLPMILPEPVKAWLWVHNFEFIAGVLGLTVYTSAFIGETVRAGIQSIDKGQTEAAQAHGLNWGQTMSYVILPQAFRVILPPLGNQFLNLIKNSSLAMTIAVEELTFQSQAVEAQTFRGFEATTAATVIYLVITLTLAGLLRLLERRTNRHLGSAKAARQKVEAALEVEGGFRA